MSAPMPIPRPPLLLVTDRRQASGPLVEVVTAALGAGCRWVSVREKDLPPGEQVSLARKLAPVVRESGARLSLHGEAALAREAGLAAVHLPGGSDPRLARQMLGPDALIGLSVHTVAEAASIDPAMVDYVVAGPFHETISKPGYGPALGTSGVVAMARAAPVPLITIGGIEADNIGEAIAAGAAGVAVMGGVMRAADPGTEVRRLLAAVTL